MTLPALIVDFPRPGSQEHSQRATLLGKQWPVCWVVGNNFMRPISAFTTLGYSFVGASLFRANSPNWKWFALCAALHLTVLFHSAINMQPLNAKLTALAGTTSDGKGSVAKNQDKAEETARKWIKGNLYRVAIPFVTGTIAIWQVMFA